MSRLLILCLFVSGCSLYWGHDSGDDVCTNGGYGEDAQQLRNPLTGQCESGGGGGGGCCGVNCATPATTGGGSLVPLQDWGACSTSCDSLDETSCKSTTGCQAAYLDNNLADPSSRSFVACWSTATYDTTVAGTTCVQRDAYSCAQSDACSPVFTGTNGSMKWEQCVPEHSNCDLDCAVGSHCEQQCVLGSCTSEHCTDACAATCVPDNDCSATTCGQGFQCVEQCNEFNGPCSATCVPTGTDPGTCGGAVTCALMAPSCPANTTAGVANGCWTGFCIPNADCGTHDPGHCYDQVTCNSAAPACPMGTLPGIKNSCYTGYCVPTYGCEISACETLSTEATCKARSDCSAVYHGSNCTCDTLDNCTCESETYSKCESLLMPL